jgi:hypothetical protein
MDRWKLQKGSVSGIPSPNSRNILVKIVGIDPHSHHLEEIYAKAAKKVDETEMMGSLSDLEKSLRESKKSKRPYFIKLHTWLPIQPLEEEKIKSNNIRLSPKDV